ncbi:beta-N-acetylglucosaminidase [Clostridium sporogenes]|uniref:triple tyrosine motif-containing protein n=1 Tax=Clostridium sporogenes TaxID=1509 RepID=UPI0013D651C3|nr:triple tyrosine motif-containing protein [Clostridium sporogenes]NFV12576.1 beta-N-acetylglucosaminidase [Clostridium sporogenes]
MINKKRSYLGLSIISLFFIIGLLILPKNVQAYNNLIINLEVPKENEILNGNELNVKGSIDSKEKVKSIEVYLNNEKIGQAEAEVSISNHSIYTTKFQYKKDIDNIKSGEHLLKIIAIDKNEQKEEKSLKIYVENQQKKTVENNKLQSEENNNTYKETKASSVPLTGKATIQTYDIMLGNQYITSGKLSSGKTYTIKGYASSPNGVLYEFWVKEASTGVWTKIRDYKEDRYANWTPNKNGQYVIAVNVKDKYSNANVDGRVEKTFTVEIQAGKAAIQTYDIMLGDQYITSSKLSSGKTYTIKGYASSPNGVLYEFWVKEVSTGVWTKIRDYKEDRYANWTPSKNGQYVIAVNVKDKYSNANVDGRIEKTFTVEIQAGKAAIQTYDIMLGNQYITNGKLSSGKTYTIKGYASSPNGVLYEFWVKEVSTGVWTKIRDYKEDRYANWTPSKNGQYVIAVNVKDKYSNANLDGRIEKTFTVETQSGKATIQTYDIMLGDQYITSGKLSSGKTYTIKGYASSPNGVLYEFWVKEVSTGVWTKISDYKKDRYANWTPNKSGQYVIAVNVKDKFSTANIDGRVEKTFTVEIQAGKATIQTYDIMLGNQYITNGKLSSGKTYTIKGYASSPNGVLYEFWVKEVSTGVWTKVRDYKEDRYANWTPSKSGQYVIAVNVKDKYSNENIDGRVEKSFYVDYTEGKATIQTYDIMLGEQYITSYQLEIGKTYTIKGYASSTNRVLYEFWIKDLNTGNLTKIRDFNEDRYANWIPSKSGRYSIIVKVKDIFSSSAFDSQIEKAFTIIGEDGLVKNYKKSYYDMTLDEMVNKQMDNRPAYHMYIPEKNTYEWRYAIIKNGKKGYSTDINGVNWVQSDQQYDYIKSKAREYIDPTNQIYDDIGQYQFLQLSYNECTTAEQLNSILKGKGVLEGKGQIFIDAGRESNVSPIYLVAHAILETGNGTSTLAKGVVVNGKMVYNLFGINAVDSDPIGQGSKYAYEQGWFSIDLAIKGGAKWISSGYINNTTYKQDTLYKMRWNPGNPTVHQYATDVRWVYNQIGNIKKVIDELSGVTLNFDIPIFK